MNDEEFACPGDKLRPGGLDLLSPILVSISENSDFQRMRRFSPVCQGLVKLAIPERHLSA